MNVVNNRKIDVTSVLIKLIAVDKNNIDNLKTMERRMKKIDLTKGKVIKVITALSLPIMASSLLQFTYNLVDMLWVGGLGSDAVASIGSSSFYIGLGYSINALVVIGTKSDRSHVVL